MNKTLLIARTEIGTSLRRKTFVIFAFGLPILIGIIALGFSLFNSDGGESDQQELASQIPGEGHVGYVDPSGIIESIPANVPQEWLSPYPDAESAGKALEEGEIEGFFQIPEDYVATGDLRYVRREHNPLSSNPTQAFEWVLLYNLTGSEEALATSLWQPFELTLTSLAPPPEETLGDSWIEELLPTMMTLLLYMVIIMTASVLMSAISDEKKNRVMEILLSSSSTNQFVGGKILAGGILGLMMILVWLAVFWGVITFGGQPLNIPFDFELPGELLFWAIIFAFLGYAMYGSLMAGLGALAPDIKDARSTSFVILSPLILGYMLNVFIQSSPDGPLAVVASIFPLTAPVVMIIRMTMTTVPVWQVVLAALLMVVASFFIIRGVSHLFRAQILLGGQPASVRRYYRAMIGRV